MNRARFLGSFLPGGAASFLLFACTFPCAAGCTSGSNDAPPVADAADDTAGPTSDADGGGTDASVDGADGEVGVDGAPVVTAALPLRDCKTSFAYPLGRSAGKVELIGEWDKFAAHTAMTDGLGSGTYRVELTLPPGSYGYKYVVDGADYQLDPRHKYTRYVGGVENSRIDVPDCRDPLLQVTTADATPDGTVDLWVQYVDGALAKGPDLASLKAALTRGTLPTTALSYEPATGQLHLHLTGLSRDKYTFTFDVSDAAGRKAQRLTVPMWVEAEPFQWQDGPLYFVFTDRFRNGDPSNDAPVSGIDARANYQGGDYAGVLAALKDGYFDQLGVRSIWLSPVNVNSKSPGAGLGGHLYSGYHGYWVSSPDKVEEHWGSLDDLRTVTAEAHKRGIRVLLDLVQNQLHQDHPYYVAHKKDGWFNGDGSCVCGGAGCDWDTHRLDCWFTPYLPDVNWTNMDMVDTMASDATRWLVAADADGFRVDAVKHMQDIATTTLRIRIQRELEAGNARYYLVGETFTGGDGRPLINHYVGDQLLWGQFDFPLYWAIDNAFAQGGGTMGDLDATVLGGEKEYVPSAVMSPFLGNQDVARFLSRAAGQVSGDPVTQAWTSPPAPPDSDEPYDRLFLAFTFLLGQRGVPLVYDGDEIGMPGTNDPDNRRMMRFGSALSAREQKLLDRVRIVAKARGTLPALRRGARRTLFTDGDGYVFSRGAAADLAVIALNRGTTARVAHVLIPPELGLPDGTALKDLLGGPSVTVTGGAIDVPLTARGAQLFVRP